KQLNLPVEWHTGTSLSTHHIDTEEALCVCLCVCVCASVCVCVGVCVCACVCACVSQRSLSPVSLCGLHQGRIPSICIASLTDVLLAERHSVCVCVCVCVCVTERGRKRRKCGSERLSAVN